MSLAEKALKTVALPIAKLGFTNVPQLCGGRGSYGQWLKALLVSKPNQKLFLKHEKDVIDQCFREQIEKQYALDNNKLRQALADIDQPSSKDFWSQLKSNLLVNLPKVGDAASSEIATVLTLPRVGVGLGGGRPSVHGWDDGTYEDFAWKAKRANPDTVFTKDVMDAAFRKAVFRVATSALTQKKRINGVLTRCLGKESTEYWKDQ